MICKIKRMWIRSITSFKSFWQVLQTFRLQCNQLVIVLLMMVWKQTEVEQKWDWGKSFQTNNVSAKNEGWIAWSIKIWRNRALWNFIVVASSTIVEKWPISPVYHSPLTTALRNFDNDLCLFFFPKFTAPSNDLFDPAFFDCPSMCGLQKMQEQVYHLMKLWTLAKEDKDHCRSSLVQL